MNEFLAKSGYCFRYVFFFSMFVNILQLTFSVYMLEVYDLVLTSYNLSTLAVITIAAFICLIALACLDWIRARIMVRVGVELDKSLSRQVLAENIKNASSPQRDPRQASMQDLQTLRTFLGGSAVFAFFDAPWMPVYFLAIFYLHFSLGLVAVGGGLVVLVLGLLNNILTRRPLDMANNMNRHSGGLIGTALRNAGIVRSMGMLGPVAARWEKSNHTVIDLQTRASHWAGLLQAVSHALRTGLQVVIYAVGAYLAVTHVATAGAMIAASIIMGRALAPIDQIMNTYKLSLEAHNAYKRLKALLDAPPKPSPMDLPAPSGQLNVENLYFNVMGRAIIQNVSFALPAGSSLAIIGPSAAGKSTLCKLMLGVWPASMGKVRIDGSDIATWDMEKLGASIGYLPQDVELFAGTIAENIARMGKVDMDKVRLAANIAGIHALMERLPDGYDTTLGEDGLALSGGQRQRIGLARALYGLPRVLVLDEPNSNLDEEGEAGLLQAIVNLRRIKSTVALVTHKPAILSLVDYIMVLREGHIMLMGPRQEVLAKLAEAQRQQQESMKRRQEMPQQTQQGPAHA
jgi:PrtD family type I secretion system ABC transporter